MGSRLSGFWLVGALSVACASSDPAVTDPRRRDAAFPAAMEGIAFESHGASLNGVVYGAAGPGPHPTLVLLHGLPGDERNLDLAQAVRRAGWNVLFFHYRGAWGSEGEFSFSNALADVAAAVDLATSPAFGEDWRADPARIAVLGHSMGGFLALAAGSDDPRVRCIGSLAGANLGLFGTSEALASRVAEGLDSIIAPLRGTSGAALVAETRENPHRFDLNRRAGALSGRALFLAAGRLDRVAPPALHHEPLVAALRAVGPRSLRVQVFEADHAFTSRRVALARSIVDWLRDDCTAPPGPGQPAG